MNKLSQQNLHEVFDMYPLCPSRIKNTAELLVKDWKELVVEDDRLPSQKNVNDWDLLAKYPKWKVLSLRSLLKLVIASYDYLSFYTAEITRAHQKHKTQDHPFWSSDAWVIDYVALITKGIDSLRNEDVLLLALDPGAITIAHEIVREEIMYGDRISEEWHDLVIGTYKKLKQEKAIAAKEVEKILMGTEHVTLDKEMDLAQIAGRTISSETRKKLLLRMISGNPAQVIENELATSNECDDYDLEKIARCLGCKKWFMPKEECWEHCETCAGEYSHIEDITDKAEDLYLLENGASLSHNSLEKLWAREELEMKTMPAANCD